MVSNDNKTGTLQATLRPPDTLPPMTERVLVLPRESVPDGTAFHGVRAAHPTTLTELRRAVAEAGRYVERTRAEDDATVKQLIPYVVVRDGKRVFLMERTAAGRDARLHGKASIGVGGHLNPVDAGEDALMAGLRREWAEELEADWDPEFELIGLLNDDSNPVGAVHLGVVFQVEASGRSVSVREHDKLIGRFVDPADVVAAWGRLETWSQLVASTLGIAPR